MIWANGFIVKIMGWFAGAYGWVWGTVYNHIKLVWNWAFGWGGSWVNDLFYWLSAQVPPGLKEFLKGGAGLWSVMSTWWARAEAIFPISACLAMLGLTLGFVVGVRIARWVKSFVPTIGD